MSTPFSDTTAPLICRTDSGALDHACYERRAHRLRAAAMQGWLNAAIALFKRGMVCLRECARRLFKDNELHRLDGAARRDLALGASDLPAIADGSFASDPTRRARGKAASTAPAGCWMNGALVPLTDARVSVFDHGLLYGDGVFEGIRFYRRRAFRLADHLQRLFRSAAALRLDIPYDASALTVAVQDTIAAFDGENGYLRLVVTRGEGKLGLDPASCPRANVFIIADTLALVSATARDQGARLIIASTRRLPPDGLDPRIKSLNYLNHILARMEASHTGADEAILLNAQGKVAEGTADNIFIVRDGELLTPPVTDGALEGITREVVLSLAATQGIPAREISLAPYDLYTADECLLTGTGAELIPVREVDGRKLRQSPGPVYRQLQRAFHALTEAEAA